MKKIALFISVVALIATACSKESQEMIADSNEGVSTSYIFTLEADMGEATKTAYADDKTFSWSTGDQISVLFHKDDVNKFYTLTTNTGGSKTATFSGPVDKGWTEGGTDDAKVALFPASAGHVYTAGEPNPISFNIPAKTDFSSTHFSANIPMLGKDNGAGAYQFQHITGSYKFTFTGIPAAVTKVMLTAENIGNGYYLSGNSPVKGSGSDTYLNCYTGSGSTIASYIAIVTDGTVSFYIPYRAWEGLRAKLTLSNMTPGSKLGYTICEFTGKSVLANASLSEMNVLPSKNISAYGEGSPYLSAFGVNWASIDMYPLDAEKDAFPGDGARTIDWKATSDATYLYFLFKTSAAEVKTRGVWSAYLVTAYDIDNNATTGGSSAYSLGDGFEAESVAFPFSNSAGNNVTFYLPSSPNSSSKINCPISEESLGTVTTSGGLFGDYAFAEVRIPRSQIGNPASGVTIRVRNSFTSAKSDAQTITLY